MAKADFSYEVSEERLRAYSRVSLYDRLRWLEDLCRFTAIMRTAETREYSEGVLRAKAGLPPRRE